MGYPILVVCLNLIFLTCSLDLIFNKITELDEFLNETLRIRVGINNGGRPIVAGVLGTEKPTFEILGPTINIAQQNGTSWCTNLRFIFIEQCL